LDPQNIAKHYEALQKWQSVVKEGNVWLLYELGRIAFALGYYDKSRKTFDELETGVGASHRLRSKTRNLLYDDKGKEKVFEGSIARIDSRYDGEINCDTLRSLRYPINFRPVTCAFNPAVGFRVKFYIGFSFRGPCAVQVRRV